MKKAQYRFSRNTVLMLIFILILIGIALVFREKMYALMGWFE